MFAGCTLTGQWLLPTQTRSFTSINGNVCFRRKRSGRFCDRDPNPLMTETGWDAEVQLDEFGDLSRCYFGIAETKAASSFAELTTASWLAREMPVISGY